MMLYNEFEREVDRLQSEIRALKSEGKYKEAEIKGLDLVYLKVNYYENCMTSEKIHSVNCSSFKSQYQTALYELANKRDALFDKFGYEEV